MNEFYLPKELICHKQYLIEHAIYEDIYQYRENDNITLKMLQSIILNHNTYLFIQILSKKSLSQQEITYLLEIICKEGDSYFSFFEIVFNKCIVEEKLLLSLLDLALLSSGIKIINFLFLKYENIVKQYITKDIIQNCLEKNPDKNLIEYLIQYIDSSIIFTQEFLEETINNDNVYLLIMYTKHQKYNNWNSILDKAIEKNAYDIIEYILTQISTYYIKQESNKYNDFFDYLITEKLEKIINFLDKIDKLELLGMHNLQKLLLAIESYEDFELLLFKYQLTTINFINESLQQKIKKILLNKKLKNKLKEKNNKEIKKI